MSLYDHEDRYDRIATEAEAHAEWHLNAGVPMGQPGCPWDACHDEPDYDDEPLELADVRCGICGWTTGCECAGLESVS